MIDLLLSSGQQGACEHQVLSLGFDFFQFATQEKGQHRPDYDDQAKQQKVINVSAKGRLYDVGDNHKFER